jgi:hypothetical protein
LTTAEKQKKELKITVVDYETFSDYDYVPVAAHYFKNAMGEFVHLHSSDRLECQNWIDENYGPNKYKVIPSKIAKTKSKLESGGLSVYATATRSVKR